MITLKYPRYVWVYNQNWLITYLLRLVSLHLFPTTKITASTKPALLKIEPSRIDLIDSKFFVQNMNRICSLQRIILNDVFHYSLSSILFEKKSDSFSVKLVSFSSKNGVKLIFWML